MNQHMTRRFFPSTLAFAGALLLSTPILAAESNHGNQLDGTWMVTVYRVSPPPGVAPTFLGLLTMTPDGQVLEESNTTAIRSLGHGEWIKMGPRQFRRVTVNFRFAPPPAAFRTYIGVTRIVADLQLNKDGDEFTAESIIENYDADGNLIASSPGTETGRLCDSRTSVKRCMGLE
jgi:hypothetical protein